MQALQKIVVVAAVCVALAAPPALAGSRRAKRSSMAGKSFRRARPCRAAISPQPKKPMRGSRAWVPIVNPALWSWVRSLR